MTIFAIIAPKASKELKAAIEREFPSSHFEIAPGQFLVSTTGHTTRKLAERIGDDGEVGEYIAFVVTSNWGYHNPELWEWLAENSK
jgi:hypothetical protein